LLFFNYIPLKN